MTHNRTPHSPAAAPEELATSDDAALDLSPEDIEAAYARALAAVEAVEQAIPELADITSAAEDDAPLPDESASEGTVSERSVGEPSTPERPAVHGPDPDREASATALDAWGPAAVDCAHEDALPDAREPLLQPRRIIEAALFVGGEPLTAKRLATLLGFNGGAETVQQLIDELNEEYHQQARPYEVRLGEGGYQLSLRPEFEDVRDRVYGRSPKEVTLSQDALEVLALVAYQQPVRCADLEAAGKTNAAAVLRQLLRRQLISLQRNADNPADVTYTTTDRFLEVFGLRTLEDLPLPDDLAFK